MKWLKSFFSRLYVKIELRETYNVVNLDSLPPLGTKERRDILRTYLDTVRFLYKESLEYYKGP